MGLMNIVRDQHEWHRQCLRPFGIPLQRREHIKLHSRQHGESCISSKCSVYSWCRVEGLDLPSCTSQNRIPPRLYKVQPYRMTVKPNAPMTALKRPFD